MSNPGVIKLSEVQARKHNFRIEDNIGEAIHFHLDEIRVDLTVEEYLRIAREARGVINSMVAAPGFDIGYFDPEFFLRVADWMPDLLEVRLEDISLDQLYIDREYLNTETDEKTIRYEKISESRVVKALKGNPLENDMREQTNLFGQTNNERVWRMLKKVREDGYPFNGMYIALVNDSNVIRDGQHRAACLHYLYGNPVIQVMRLVFRDNMYSINSRDVYREPVADFFRRYSHIFIYGAGDYGTAVKRRMDLMGLVVDGFLVTNRRTVGSVCGLPLHEIHEIRYPGCDCGIILGLHSRFHPDVRQHLLEAGFSNLYVYEDEEMERHRR